MSAITKILAQSADGDHVYYNAQINWSGTGNEPTDAMSNIQRNQALLSKSEEFYLTVARLAVSPFTIPLFVPPFQVGSNYSEGLTVYSFTLKYDGFTSGQTYMIYGSGEVTNLFANPSTGTVIIALNTENPYYYVYTFNRVCDLLNATFQAAFDSLNTASGSTLPVGAVPMVFFYDPQEARIRIKAQISSYDINTTQIAVYFNNEMSTLLNGFDYNNVMANSPDGSDCYLIVKNNVVNISPDPLFYYLTPCSWDPTLFNPCQSIQVNTSLPIVFETISPINPGYAMPTNFTYPQTLTNTSSIITDFVPDWTNPDNINSTLSYNNTDNFRYADVSGSGSILSFSISVAWVDVASRTIPLKLLNGMNVSMKLAFIRKSLVNTESTRILGLDSIIAAK